LYHYRECWRGMGDYLVGWSWSQKYWRKRLKRRWRGSRSYTMDSVCAVSVRDTTSWKHVSWKSEEFKASESQLLWNIVLYYHNSNINIPRLSDSYVVNITRYSWKMYSIGLVLAVWLCCIPS
jgi:hypothetical protein